MTTKDNASIGDLSTASLQEKDSPTPYDLDRALAEAAGEMRFDWRKLLPSERIKARIMEIALGLLLFAALIAFCCFG
jgi:hypothetical protein